MTILMSGALIGLGAAVVATLAFVAVSKWTPSRWLAGSSDAAGAIYSSVGMVYAILVAIAAIAVWEPHSAAEQSADREAGDLTEIYWVVRGLPDQDRDEIRAKIGQYTTTVVDVEWPELRDNNERSTLAAEQFDDLRARIEAVVPADEQQTAVMEQVNSRISDAADARRSRVAVAGASMPPLLWPALILGGIVSVVFLYLFGLERSVPNLIMMAVVGAMSALLLFVIYQIEFPFTRAFAVGPGEFQAALTRFAELS